MKKIKRQIITNDTKILIPLLLLILALVFTFCVSDVAAAQAGSDNATVPSDNLTVSQTTSNSSSSTTGNLSNSSDSKNQTLPDPVIYNGGVPVSRGGQLAGYNWGTIQNAINAAQSGDTIMLEDGATFNEYGLIISKNLDFRVFNNGHATINGGNNGIIFTINSGVVVNMYNLTIINGYGTYCGGGILNMGTLTVNNCTFSGNSASDYGGAIENYGGTMTVTGCTFTGNTADANGGAIENCYGGSLTVNNSTFIGNTAVGKTPYSDGYGGAIDNYYSTAWVNNCIFRSNSAHYGGAIFNDVSTLHVMGGTFTGNNAGYGAGIYNYYGTADVTGSHFTGNSVTGDGGAIENYGGTMTVTGCTFTGNNAGANGGAIFNYIGSAEVHFNRIVGNSNYSIYSNGGSVNAENNWWGTNFQGTNPITAGYVNSNVDADP